MKQLIQVIWRLGFELRAVQVTLWSVLLLQSQINLLIATVWKISTTVCSFSKLQYCFFIPLEENQTVFQNKLSHTATIKTSKWERDCFPLDCYFLLSNLLPCFLMRISAYLEALKSAVSVKRPLLFQLNDLCCSPLHFSKRSGLETRFFCYKYFAAVVEGQEKTNGYIDSISASTSSTNCL